MIGVSKSRGYPPDEDAGSSRHCAAQRALVGANKILRTALVALIALAGFVAPSWAQESGSARLLPSRIDEAVGTWQLSLAGTERQCRLSLSIENGRNGRQLSYLPACRQALPILGRVAGWFFLGSDIRFVDENIRPVLTFSARDDGRGLTAQVEGGSYTLVPVAIGAAAALGAFEPARVASDSAVSDLVASRRLLPGAEPTLPSDRLSPLATPLQAATPPSAAQPVQTPPGIYAVDRFSEKDVCRIELTGQPLPTKTDGSMAARILPGCRDNGVTVFDPVAWRLASGRMVLRARKGHALSLVAATDNGWRRDPDTGVTFILRKVE